MQLLSKPLNYDFKKEKKYEQLHIAKIAFTERNWTGEDYITKESCKSFLNDLKQIDEVFYSSFGQMGSRLNFVFLLDTSIFSKSADNDINSKMTDLLQEISVFQTIVIERDIEKKREANKYLKKLRNFINRVENAVYVYRWALQNPTHPFSDIVKEEIEDNMKEQGIRAKNQWVRDVKSRHPIYRKWMKQGYSEEQIEQMDIPFQQEMIMKCERRDTEFAEKLFKHTVQNPQLFFYSMHFLNVYFKQMEQLMGKGEEFLVLEKKNGNLKVFLKDSHSLLSQKFLEHEIFHSTLPRVKRRTDGTVATYSSLHELTDEIEGVDESYIDVFKTIAEWVTSRIPDNKVNILPNKKWIHPVKGLILDKLGIEYIFFEDHSFIGGPKGKELLIKSHAFINNPNGRLNKDIMFAIFDPSSWDNLTPAQCALLSYACCLYHDVCIQNNYDLVRQDVVTDRENFEYLLITKEHNQSVEPLQTHSFSPKEKKDDKKTKVQTEIKKEHWVSFHFRRLRQKQRASESAREKARKYGIHKLPIGFTFVDSFVKGERTEDVSEMRISALAVLNKTLNKVTTYKPQELTS